MKRIEDRKELVLESAKMAYLVGYLVLGLLIPTANAVQSDSPVKCRVETDRGVVSIGSPQKVVVKVTLEAARPPKEKPRVPVNLGIVLDRSGSMHGEKLQKAKEAVTEALSRLGKRDMFSVVAYDHNVRTVVSAQRVQNMEEIMAKIRSISSGGNTALFGGVSQGASEVRKHSDEKYVNRLILLSDGLANVGPSSPEALGRLGAALSKEDISVTTVGVGLGYNEDLMTRLSRKSDGNAYFVESSKDLPSIFASELGDVLSVVAKRIRITVEFPEGVKPLGIVGRDGNIRDRKARISMNQLYGGQEKYALIEVEVPPGRALEKKDIASAVVSYSEPMSRRKATSQGKATIRFSANSADVKKSANVAVQEAYELTLNALAQDEAIALADKGRTDLAVNELNKSVNRLHNVGKRFKNTTLLDRAVQTSRRASEISAQGMTKRNRKTMKTDSYQIYNQQVVPQ
jgi:Ca-activated chloride channel family protein